MRVGVIGGTGFLGKYLVKRLIENKIKVIVFSRKKVSHFNSKYLTYSSVFDIMNISDSQIKKLKSLDVVFNLAGLVSFKQKHKRTLRKINGKGAINVVKACEMAKVKKLIHISSTAALGYSNKIIRENSKFNWNKGSNKKLVYSHSKHIANNHIINSDLNTVLVYPSLIMGPGDKTNTNKIIDSVKKMPFSMPGSNSIIDVRDAADFLFELLDKKYQNDKFILTNKNYSFKEMNNIISNVTGSKTPIFTLPKLFFPISYLVYLFEKFNLIDSILYENVFLSFKKRKHSTKKLKQTGFKCKYHLEQTIYDSWRDLNGK